MYLILPLAYKNRP